MRPWRATGGELPVRNTSELDSVRVIDEPADQWRSRERSLPPVGAASKTPGPTVTVLALNETSKRNKSAERTLGRLEMERQEALAR